MNLSCRTCEAGRLPLSSANSIFFQGRVEFRRADRQHLGAALRTRRGWQMQKCCDASVCQPRQALDQLFIRIEKIVPGRLNNAALRRWIKLKARRRFRKALGAPQSAKIHRPKIKNSHSGNHKNRAERRLHVTHQVKYRTQYLHSYVCLVAVVTDFLRYWTVRAPRPTI